MQAKYELDDVSFIMTDAVTKTVTDSPGYPAASLNTFTSSQTVSIAIEKSQTDQCQKLNQFGNWLMEHGEEHLIKPEAHGMELFTKRDISDDIVKYDINLSPKILDSLFAAFSEVYRSYRSGVGSFLLLENPNQIYLKKDKVCISPVFELENDQSGNSQVMIRNAGCNFMEVITTQLGYFFQHTLKLQAKTSHFYSHNSLPKILTNFITEDVLREAVVSCLDNQINLNHQHQDMSFTVIKLNKMSREYLVDMDESALAIYKLLTAAPPDELSNSQHIRSLEVPMPIFLKNLWFAMCKMISRREREFSTDALTTLDTQFLCFTHDIEKMQKLKELMMQSDILIENKVDILDNEFALKVFDKLYEFNKELSALAEYSYLEIQNMYSIVNEKMISSPMNVAAGKKGNSSNPYLENSYVLATLYYNYTNTGLIHNLNKTKDFISKTQLLGSSEWKYKKYKPGVAVIPEQLVNPYKKFSRDLADISSIISFLVYKNVNLNSLQEQLAMRFLRAMEKEINSSDISSCLELVLKKKNTNDSDDESSEDNEDNTVTWDKLLSMEASCRYKSSPSSFLFKNETPTRRLDAFLKQYCPLTVLKNLQNHYNYNNVNNMTFK
jgi:hypothetical protein